MRAAYPGTMTTAASHGLAGTAYLTGHGVNDFLSHGRVRGAQGAGHLCLGCHDVARGSAVYGPQGEDCAVQG